MDLKRDVVDVFSIINVDRNTHIPSDWLGVRT
jgi:hypothetical protein